MKRAKSITVSDSTERQGFTLVEVLLALAMAALGFGVILHSVGLQMSLISTSLDRHQMLMYSSEALEARLAAGTIDEEAEPVEVPIGTQNTNEAEATAELSKYFYSLSAAPVTADPRVQQVIVNVTGPHGFVRLAAYRLRVQRK